MVDGLLEAQEGSFRLAPGGKSRTWDAIRRHVQRTSTAILVALHKAQNYIHVCHSNVLTRAKQGFWDQRALISTRRDKTDYGELQGHGFVKSKFSTLKNIEKY